MALLTGMTEDGREVPVQVDGAGRLVAEGLQGPPGIVNPFQPGSAGAPGLTPDGDPDTGIFSPGLNSLAASVGGKSSVQINPDGRIAVGDTIANATVQVSAEKTYRGYQTDVFDFSVIHLEGATAGPTSSAITFSSGSGGAAALCFARDGAYGTHVSFWTNQSGAANQAAERMRIDEWGNVGIGTVAPQAQLDVKGNIRATTAIYTSVPVHENNAAAAAGGVGVGGFYRKADGTLMIAF